MESKICFIQIALANNKSQRKALFCLEQCTISCAGFISPHFRCCWCKNPQQRSSFISAFLYHSSRLSSYTEQANLNSFNCICRQERRQSAAMPIPSFDYKESLREPARVWADETEHLQMIRETSVLPESRIKGRWSPCSASWHELHVLCSFLPGLKQQMSLVLTEEGGELSPLGGKFSPLKVLAPFFFFQNMTQVPGQLFSPGASVCLSADGVLEATIPKAWSHRLYALAWTSDL